MLRLILGDAEAEKDSSGWEGLRLGDREALREGERLGEADGEYEAL